jgi:hypothetical protein
MFVPNAPNGTMFVLLLPSAAFEMTPAGFHEKVFPATVVVATKVFVSPWQIGPKLVGLSIRS